MELSFKNKVFKLTKQKKSFRWIRFKFVKDKLRTDKVSKQVDWLIIWCSTQLKHVWLGPSIGLSAKFKLFSLFNKAKEFLSTRSIRLLYKLSSARLSKPKNKSSLTIVILFEPKSSFLRFFMCSNEQTSIISMEFPFKFKQINEVKFSRWFLLIFRNKLALRSNEVRYLPHWENVLFAIDLKKSFFKQRVGFFWKWFKLTVTNIEFWLFISSLNRVYQINAFYLKR